MLYRETLSWKTKQKKKKNNSNSTNSSKNSNDAKKHTSQSPLNTIKPPNQKFLFSQGYDMDSAMTLCTSKLYDAKKDGYSGGCYPIRDSNNLYIGVELKLDWVRRHRVEEYYKMLFTLVYENNLEDYQDEILNYIRKLKKIANVHPRLMHVAIFSVFRTERKRLSILFPEIYRQFGNHLEISKMSNDDKEYIMNTFINAVEKIGKEQINAIQKNT